MSEYDTDPRIRAIEMCEDLIDDTCDVAISQLGDAALAARAVSPILTGEIMAAIATLNCVVSTIQHAREARLERDAGDDTLVTKPLHVCPNQFEVN